MQDRPPADALPGETPKAYNERKRVEEKLRVEEVIRKAFPEGGKDVTAADWRKLKEAAVVTEGASPLPCHFIPIVERLQRRVDALEEAELEGSAREPE